MTALRAVRQQLEADRLLGIRSVPVPLPEPVPSKPGKRDVRVVDPEVAAQKAEQLRALDENEVNNCTKCSLHKTRTKTVFGVGDPCARLVFVGEAPQPAAKRRRPESAAGWSALVVAAAGQP